jgi:hypothetical protein
MVARDLPLVCWVIRDLLTAHPSIAVYPDKRTISEPYTATHPW